MEALVPYLVIIPLGFGLLIPLVARTQPRLADALGNLACLSLLVISLLLFGKDAHHFVGGWKPPVGIPMIIDPLSLLLLLIINGVGFCSALFSIRYMDQYTGRGSYYGLLLLMIAGMNGVAITGDLFNLYVFLEIAGIASYALVAFGCEAEELEASFKYAILGSLASLIFLLGLAVLYLDYGTVNMAQLAQRLTIAGKGNLEHFALILMVAGLSLKSALVPFHAWLPDAHPSAPAPVSAMLSGVLIKAIGVYALVRVVFNVFGFNTGLSYLLLTLGVLSMIGGVLLAIGQWDYKRLLAYHSISQIGYVILGIGLGTPLGILGGLFHLLNHAAFKSLLFLTAGAVEYRTGTRDLKEMGGLREKMPVSAGSSLVGSFSIAGVPPFNGFFSKLIIIIACVQAKHYGLAGAAVVVSILTLASFMKVQRYGFFGELKERWEKIKEVPISMQVAMLLLALACLGLSLLILPDLRELVLVRAERVLSEGTRIILAGL